MRSLRSVTRFPLRAVAALAAVVVSAAQPAAADEIVGAGSTFVHPAMSQWAAAYAAQGRDRILYHPIGSGAGLAEIKSGVVDFAASDAPLQPEALARAGLRQFPLVIGGIVPVVNIAGVAPGELRLTGPLLAEIYLGRIRRWNDRAIGDLNPGLVLPDAAIVPAHRLDSSGTSFNWAYYLAQASDDWRRTVGWGTTVSWPVGAGGKGNDGLAAFVARTPNSIGYVEPAYAQKYRLAHAVLRNRARRYVEPTAASFEAAAATADWDGARDFCLMIADAAGEDAWPVAATVFAVMRREAGPDIRAAQRRDAALRFFRWVLQDGRKIAGDLGYVPLPAALAGRIERGPLAPDTAAATPGPTAATAR